MIVCVLGMHRSGSSLVAQILARNGYGAGSSLVGRSEFNVDGHFEDRFVVNTNKRLLRHFGGTWDRPPAWPEGWLEDSRVRALLARASAYRTRVVEEDERFFFKDPRTCLTLPFWQRAFGEMRYVVTLRSIESVVGSVCSRHREWMRPSRFGWRLARFVYHNLMGAYEPLNPLSPGDVRVLWEEYYAAALTYLGGARAAVVRYETLLATPEDGVRQLLTELGAAPRALDHSVVKASLNHSERPQPCPREAYYFDKFTQRPERKSS